MPEARPLEILSVDQLMSLPKPDWLVQEVLPEASSAFLYGPSGVGKSFLALDLALSIAIGRPWHGHQVKKGNVLYVVTEGALGFQSRLSSWRQQAGVHVGGEEIGFIREAIQLVTDEQRVVQAVRERKPVLVILDTLAQVSAGLEENAGKDMGELMQTLRKIRQQHDSTVLVVHHTGHQESRMRGHSSLKANADWILGLREQRGKLLLKREKARDASTGQVMSFVLQAVGDSCVLVPLDQPSQAAEAATAASQIPKRVSEMLAPFVSPGTMLTTAVWRKAVPLAETTFHRHRRAIQKDGLIECLTSRGVWRLTSLGATLRSSFETQPVSSDLSSAGNTEPGGIDTQADGVLKVA